MAITSADLLTGLAQLKRQADAQHEDAIRVSDPAAEQAAWELRVAATQAYATARGILDAAAREQAEQVRVAAVQACLYGARRTGAAVPAEAL